jgi:P4 family phage/plasmid primase-like protien
MLPALTLETFPTNVAEAATIYVDRGWSPVPIRFKSKRPDLAEWTSLRIARDNVPAHFPPGVPTNIGIILGEPSNGLVDVDIDDKIALRLARIFLPSTGCLFGRESKRRSHWIYQTFTKTRRFMDPDGRATLVEIRSTGAQTVFPPSTHESGEKVEFESFNEPSTIAEADLVRRVGRLAVATLLARHWPKEPGTRQDHAMALAGVLTREGWPEKAVYQYIYAISLAAKDEEAKARARVAEYAKSRLVSGDPVCGWPAFSKLFGQQVTDCVRDWLDISPVSAEVAVPGRSYDELLAAARTLDKDSRPEAIVDQLREIAAAKLEPVGEGRLLELIKDRTNTPRLDLRKALKRVSHGAKQPRDLPARVADETLTRHFASGQHLVRTDRMFWRYTDGYWQRVSDERVLGRLIETAQDVVDPVEATAGAIGEQALKFLRGKLAAEGDPLRLTDEPRPVINVENGELWLDGEGTPTLRPHDPKSYLTYRLDVTFDPEATCPKYDEAVRGIFARSADPEGMVRHFNEFFGYAIQPGREIAAYFIMRGMGANGKSSLLGTVQRLMGPTAVLSTRIGEVERSPFSIANLAGRLLLLDEDVATGTKLPDGLMKKISERKPMTGEYKYGASFQFVSVALPVLLCNNYPNVSDLSPGMLRRAHIVPFDRVFGKEERNPALFRDIWQDELPGILNRAIEGLKRLKERGDFEPPEDCDRAHKDWLAHSNPLCAFIAEQCEEDPTHNTDLKDVYRAFQTWAKVSGIKSISSKNVLGRNLENLSYTVRRVHGYANVVGLSIRRSRTLPPVATGAGFHIPPSS